MTMPMSPVLLSTDTPCTGWLTESRKQILLRFDYPPFRNRWDFYKTFDHPHFTQKSCLAGTEVYETPGAWFFLRSSVTLQVRRDGRKFPSVMRFIGKTEEEMHANAFMTYCVTHHHVLNAVEHGLNMVPLIELLTNPSLLEGGV